MEKFGVNLTYKKKREQRSKNKENSNSEFQAADDLVQRNKDKVVYNRTVSIKGGYISSGVVHVATGQVGHAVNIKNEKGLIGESTILEAVEKFGNSEFRREDFKTLKNRQETVSIGDKQFSFVPAGATMSLPKSRGKISGDIEVNKIAENLAIELDAPILVYENIYEAFTYNSNNGGKAYAISIDNVDLSLAGVKMLDGFKKSFFQNKALMAQGMNIEKANTFALTVGPTIESIKFELFKANQKPTLQNIADKLEEQNVSLPSGKTNWTPAAVKRIFGKYEQLSK